MQTIIKIAWRNIWRNKMRTMVVVMAMAVGLSSGLFAVAFSRGFIGQLVSDVVDTESSHLLVVAGQPGGGRLIGGASGLARQLEALDGVLQASPRLVLQTMVSTAYASTNVLLTGVDPDAEVQLTGLNRHITTENGSFFDTTTASPIVIGRRLAADLNVALNERIVATFRDTSGEVVSTLFRVAGIYALHNSSFERRHAYVLRHELSTWHAPAAITDDDSAAQALTMSPPAAANEIALRLDKGLQAAEAQQAEVNQWLTTCHGRTSAQALQVLSWQDLRPEVAFFYRYAGLINTIILGVILLALSLVVVNTMLMVVNERHIELGVLRALGMKDQRLVAMIMTETCFMMLPGVAISLLISFVLTTWLGQTGIDLSGYMQDYASPTQDYQSLMTVVPRVFPVYAAAEVVRVSVMVVCTAMLAAWVPARNAIRINPAEAVKSMI